jgi:mRNA interferase RelE/StbE
MKIWILDFHNRAKKQIQTLPKAVQKRIVSYFEERVLTQLDPSTLASQLVGEMTGFYRYRIGDYRVITSIDQGKMVILALEIGHRKEIYKKIRH